MYQTEKPSTIRLSANIQAEEIREIWIYALSEAGFNAFEEEGDTVNAFIESGDWEEERVKEVIAGYLPESEIVYTLSIIEAQNWNEEWEKNYPNLYIDSFCQVLPSFRTPEPGFEYTIIIDPKMSFGTGHHATTQLMMLFLRSLDCKDKRVMDMGCGTGILGILASFLGAKEVTGIDIDPWCVENSLENIELNNVGNMTILQGGAEVLPQVNYQVFIANINRHILLADGESYSKHLEKGSTLLLSGFYEADIRDLVAHFTALGMAFKEQKVQNNWAGLRFERLCFFTL